MALLDNVLPSDPAMTFDGRAVRSSCLLADSCLFTILEQRHERKRAYIDAPVSKTCALKGVLESSCEHADFVGDSRE